MKNFKWFKKVKSIWTQESGIVSVLVTILCLIGVMVVAFLLDRTHQNFIIQEVRGIMDSSAQNTLVSSLSDSHLKEELFGFSEQFISEDNGDAVYDLPASIESEMENTYESQLRDYVQTSDMILEIKVEKLNFKFAKGKWGLGSIATKSRPYLVLDSVVQLRLNHTQSFDFTSSFKNSHFEDVDGNTFEIQHIGTPVNSEILLVVRSVSRAVFR